MGVITVVMFPMVPIKNEDHLRGYLKAHDLYVVSRSILETIVELDGCYIVDASDPLRVVVRRKGADDAA
jgi:hypothetical protein